MIGYMKDEDGLEYIRVRKDMAIKMHSLGYRLAVVREADTDITSFMEPEETFFSYMKGTKYYIEYGDHRDYIRAEKDIRKYNQERKAETDRLKLNKHRAETSDLYVADHHGNIIDSVSSVQAGISLIHQYEEQDKADGIYEPDFYEVMNADGMRVDI